VVYRLGSTSFAIVSMLEMASASIPTVGPYSTISSLPPMCFKWRFWSFKLKHPVCRPSMLKSIAMLQAALYESIEEAEMIYNM